jgi:hypothetical protein
MTTQNTQVRPLVGIADRIPDVAEYVRTHAHSPGDPLRRELGRLKSATIRLAVLMNEQEAARKLIALGGPDGD